MAASKQDISRWFDDGKADAWDYMIVVCDTFDHEDYPVYCSFKEVNKKYDEYSKASMQRVMEVYHLNSDKQRQMAEHRTMRLP